MSNYKDQARWWKYAAGTIPFVGLAALVLLDIFGWPLIYNKLFFFILIGFFTSGVLWWWWAVDKIVSLTQLLLNTEQKFKEINNEIKEIKKEVESLDEHNKT